MRPAGLIPVLATPFTDSGELDLESLTRLVEFQKAAGADGIAIFGMASETFALDFEERQLILKTVAAASDGLTLVAGVAATGLAPAIEQLRLLAESPAHTAMVLPPFMVKPDGDQLIDFFGGIGSAAETLGMSVMVQDAPGASGVSMAPGLIASLASLPGVSSVKVEAPPTAPKISAVQAALGTTTLEILGGQNAQFVLDEYAAGAIGTMPACEFTDLLAPILQLWEAGERLQSRKEFALLLPLIVWGLQSGRAWAVHKEVLVRRGIIASAAVRSPASPLTSAMRDLLEEVLAPLPMPHYA